MKSSKNSPDIRLQICRPSMCAKYKIFCRKDFQFSGGGGVVVGVVDGGGWGMIPIHDADG